MFQNLAMMSNVKIFIDRRIIIKETRPETKRLDLQFHTYINPLCIYKTKQLHKFKKTSIKKATFKTFGSNWRQDVIMSPFAEAPSSLNW